MDDSPATVHGNQAVNVTLAVNDSLSDNAWDALADKLVTVTNQDNDVPGFTLSETAATVSEDAAADSFTVVLTAKPLSNVVLDVTSGNTSEVQVSAAQLTFTPGNWNSPQAVTLSGVNDSPPTVDGDQTVTVTVAVADSLSDNSWDPLPEQFLRVTNPDNDTAGFALSKTAATVSENGTFDTFTIVLTAKPL